MKQMFQASVPPILLSCVCNKNLNWLMSNNKMLSYSILTLVENFNIEYPIKNFFVSRLYQGIALNVSYNSLKQAQINTAFY